jgi:F0F1-type ATP synthase assembly protein I
LLANVYAVWRVYASLVDASAERTLLNLYRAEFGKLVIIGALCALAFALIKDLAIAGFLTGLVTALLAATLGAITVQSSDT